MKNRKSAKIQVSDYAWLGTTQRSWHVWVGNPFCVSLNIISLKKYTKERLIQLVRNAERKRKSKIR